ncbi:MAG: acylphosphatase [Desulfuromonas sp.]|nr:MAG: acylphosphatase [Desulfuromonas sp.]
MTRANLLISGRVQGVWYRASTRDVATKHGIKGWVRNLPDGRVEAMLEGDQTSVQKVIDWCRQGPPGALVTEVEVTWSEASGEFPSFSVVR